MHELRTITAPPPVEVMRMHEGQPILEAVPEHGWERRVVLNPAAVLIEEGAELDRLLATWGLSDDQEQRLREAGGACVMLYRAQGDVEPDKQMAPSYLGLAVFTPLLELVKRWTDPVLSPTAPFHNLGVEDPRCTRVGDTYYLYYTGYACAHPQDAEAPRRVQICLATTQDFLQWDLHGPLAGDLNAVANKNAALFPQGESTAAGVEHFRLLHRPMEGPDAMTIHLAEASSPVGPWRTRGPLLASYPYREFARSWIGAGGPPVPLGGTRYLMIYHQGHFTPEGRREYDLAAALLDLAKEAPVRGRIEPLMRPTSAAEQQGDPDLGVDNVLFTCANYQWGDQVVIPYAGADSRIFGASVNLKKLVDAFD